MPRSHAHLPRLYVEADLAPGAAIALGRDQSNYLAAVLRLGPGAEAVLFNGRDGAFLCRITGGNKKALVLEAVERIAAQTVPADLHYLFAPLKTGRLDYMVQKATEMGAAMLRPVITSHTQLSRLNLDRLAANIVEAAEQCEVLTVPELCPPLSLDAVLGNWSASDPGRVIVFADEQAPSGSPIEALRPFAARPLAVLVGPEGGFSDEERARLLAHPDAVPISLGPRILRADTAAVAALAVVQSIIGDWR